MKLTSLHEALIHELKDLYSAETQLTKALPKMAKAASNEELSSALEEHLEETHGHVTRLEDIFEELEASPRGQKCKAMEGLVEEGESNLKEDGPAEVLDALIISAAQKVEHYEIAGYGTARAFAKKLGMKDVARVLSETLDEESAADEKLTAVAEATVNAEAIA